MTTPRPGDKGRVISVNLSDRKGGRKRATAQALLVLDRGLEDDAHAGDWHRQVSLLALESIRQMVARGLQVGPGDFAENLTTEGLEIMTLPVGSLLKVGPRALLEVSQVGKTCHHRCAVYEQAGDCVMPREGIFGVVRRGGPVRAGDTLEVLSLGDGRCQRSPQESLVESARILTLNRRAADPEASGTPRAFPGG